MNNEKSRSALEDTSRIEAVELYKKALILEKRNDYSGARKYYEQSLDLYDDEEVQTAYLRLLSVIGPL
jgi:tetratricopeptide (TPR) repeat protein